MKNQSILQPQMTEAAIHLGQNLVSSEQYVRYQQAEQAVKGDAVALDLLNNLSQVQARIRKTQSKGMVTPEDLQTLGNLQMQVQTNSIIIEYTTCKQELTLFLQEINAEISQLLGINFALIARRSSCC